MLWITRLSTFLSLSMVLIALSPSLPSFPPAEAIRSSHPTSNRKLTSSFRRSTSFFNSPHCYSLDKIHIAMTLDKSYLRGSVAAVHSILQHSFCPQNIIFHFLVSDLNLQTLVQSTFPDLKFHFYYFDPSIVQNLISTSVREALKQPLNYARNYLAEILDDSITKLIYLDSDLIVVDDISKLWMTQLDSNTIGAPVYCHANFTSYFTSEFWSDERFSGTFAGREPCYFNTGVMVIDLVKWRRFGYTKKIERWMEIQKNGRIYELGSLPPFLLVFAGHVAPIEHRWNQHGLGGDNVKGSCRNLHPGPVSLLHWSGSGKPWIRVDENRPCPLDSLWTPYDLYGSERGHITLGLFQEPVVCRIGDGHLKLSMGNTAGPGAESSCQHCAGKYLCSGIPVGKRDPTIWYSCHPNTCYVCRQLFQKLKLLTLAPDFSCWHVWDFVFLSYSVFSGFVNQSLFILNSESKVCIKQLIG